MARPLYLREYRIRVAGLTIEGLLRVVFRVRQSAALGDPAGGVVEVYNLTADHERQINERRSAITVEAGYHGDIGVIFDGEVERVDRVRDRLDRRIRLEVVGRASGRTRESGVSIRTFEAGTPLGEVVADLADDLDLTAGDFGPLDGARLDGAWSWDATTVEGLEALLRPRGLRAYEEAGVLHVDREGRLHPDAIPLLISPSTGMILSPTVTDQGIRIRTQLDHRVQIGAEITVETEDEAARGVWKCAAFAHVGTTDPSGRWETLLDCLPMAAGG